MGQNYCVHKYRWRVQRYWWRIYKRHSMHKIPLNVFHYSMHLMYIFFARFLPHAQMFKLTKPFENVNRKLRERARERERERSTCTSFWENQSNQCISGSTSRERSEVFFLKFCQSLNIQAPLEWPFPTVNSLTDYIYIVTFFIISWTYLQQKKNCSYDMSGGFTF